MERLIQVVEYDPIWNESFREEASRLQAILGQEVIAIHHIGSTSIPNLSAKPIVDMLVEVRRIALIDDFNPTMRQQGYLPKGENGIPGRRYFIKGNEAFRTHHVHIFERGHPDLLRHLNFRDYLRTHPDEASRYGKLKETLAQQFPKDAGAYQSGKAEMIQELEQKATRWRTEEAVYPILAEDFPRLMEVWEASVRATHHFVNEADIQIFRPLVQAALPHIDQLACVRDEEGQVTGFTAAVDGKVEMLFIHPDWRGQGAGGRLLRYAIRYFGATCLDVNEQNQPAVDFYLHMGFEVVGRSELDSTGKPYPLLHMRLARRDG